MGVVGGRAQVRDRRGTCRGTCGSCVVKLMVVQADTEFASIQQHRPWLDRAPTLEDRWIESRIVADEARHGLQACRILRDFGEEGQRFIDELLTKREGEHKLDAFNMKFDRWSDVGAFTCLIDHVGVYQLRAFQECSYGPLARAMPLMLSEEQLHLNFGASVLRRMVQDGSKSTVRRRRPRPRSRSGTPARSTCSATRTPRRAGARSNTASSAGRTTRPGPDSSRRSRDCSPRLASPYRHPTSTDGSFSGRRSDERVHAGPGRHHVRRGAGPRGSVRPPAGARVVSARGRDIGRA